MKHTTNAKQSLQNAKCFVQEGVQQILTDSLDEEHSISVCPGATALATLSLLALGRDFEKTRNQGTEWLVKQIRNEGWGKHPGAPRDEEVSRLAQIAVQLNRGGVFAKLSVLEQSRQLSNLVLSLGNDVVPGLVGPKPEEIILPNILEKEIQKKLPPYGRTVVVAASLLAETAKARGASEAIQFLRIMQMPDGSWAEDVVATSLGILALVRYPGQEEVVQRAGRWLARKQYPSGGWPAFDQLKIWVMGWMGAIYQEMNMTQEERKTVQAVQKWLVKARNSDGSYGTTPPYTHPDLDDTAVALMAMPAERSTLNPTLQLLIRLQNNDGSWGTFPEFTGQPPEIQASVPVYIQSLDVTIHVLEAFRRQGLFLSHPVTLHALMWVLSQQKKDGEFSAVWFEGPIYGTAQALELMNNIQFVWGQWGLMRQVSQLRQKTVQYLLSSQNSDGGWGTSVVETALTLSSLWPQRKNLSPIILERGICHLLERQSENGIIKPEYKGIYAKGWNYEEPISTALTVIRALERYLRV